MRTCLVRAAIFVAVASTNAAAQSVSLTESQALAQLSSDSPRVQAIRAAVDVAQADVQAAGRWPNPRASFNREAAGGITENMTTVSQVLPITGRRGLEVQAASAYAAAAANRAEEQLRRARADLRTAFAELVYAQAREREIAAAVDRVRGLADVLRRRESAGDAAGFDRVRAEIEVAQLDALRTAAVVDRLRAQAALAGFFVQPAPSEIIAIPSAAAAAELPALEALLVQAEGTRGELLALRRDLDRAEIAERAARRRNVPEPEVVAGTKSSDAGSGDLGSVFAIHASLPLFDRAHPEQSAARARASEARARIAQFQATLRAELSALRAAVVVRREAAAQHRAAEATSAQLERIAQVSYDAGERGIFELLDALRTASAVRQRQAELELAATQTEIELQFVSGGEVGR